MSFVDKCKLFLKWNNTDMLFTRRATCIYVVVSTYVYWRKTFLAQTLQTKVTDKHFMLNTQYFVTVTDIKQREMIALERCPVCAVMEQAI